MCGIAGLVANNLSPDQLEQMARRMSEPITHRGPNDFGLWRSPDKPIALIHRRLSIQDLSPNGHQPMPSPSGRFQIVFNGEIYNFHELKSALQKIGFSFRGGSDTEVMLAAFEAWGIEASIRKFVGMFAFALYDTLSNRLFLCRDRLGEKPLYYGWINGRFAFASELKAIRKAADSRPNLQRQSISSFLRFGYIPTPYSIYEDIFKLPPASFLEIQLDKYSSREEFSPISNSSSFSPRAYWDLEAIARDQQSNLIRDEKEAIDEIDHLLEKIIRGQCIADVPVGAFLSGGIDSTIVAAVMQKVNPRPINTFTIGFNEKQFDEAPYARAIASHLGTHHTELYINAADGLNLIDEIPQWWDEPFADASQIPALLVAKMARQHVTVCLTGDGGDEFFCGYNRYFASARVWENLSKVPTALKSGLSKAILNISPDSFDAIYSTFKNFSANNRTQANVGVKAHKFANLMQFSNFLDGYKFLVSFWQNPSHLTGASEHRSVLDSIPAALDSNIANAMLWDQLGYLPDDNLAKGDRSSMAYSLETRLPLLDHRLAELSWRLPLHMKYRDGSSKWALRQVLYRYVPKNLIERPKMGFSVPIGAWLRGPLHQWGSDLLTTNNLQALSLSHKVVEQTWREHTRGDRDHANQLWTILMLLTWARHYGYLG